MTREEIGQVYKERVLSEARVFAEKQLEDVKAFVGKEEYNDTLHDLMAVFVAGADCSKRVLEEVIAEYKKGGKDE